MHVLGLIYLRCNSLVQYSKATTLCPHMQSVSLSYAPNELKADPPLVIKVGNTSESLGLGNHIADIAEEQALPPKLFAGTQRQPGKYHSIPH